MRLALATLAFASAAGACLAVAAPAVAHEMVAIDEAGQMFRFSSKNPRAIEKVNISGTDARIVGIDMRPADQTLYGVSRNGTIYRIDSGNGRAMMMSRMSVPLTGSVAMVDFNPVADRMRVVTSDGRNLRVNIETGETTEDGKLNYNDGSTSGGITGGGYTNSVRGATTTELWQVDGGNQTLSLQDPPNAGTLNKRSAIALTGGTKDLHGGDVVTDASGRSEAYVVRGSRLFKIDLATGQIAMVGQVGAVENSDLVDVAVVRIEDR